MRADAGNTQGFLEALQQMLRKLRNYNIWLYVDRAPWHKGEAVEMFVQSHTELHLKYLPPYQPALNPQERIWRQTRYEITRNVWFSQLESMHTLIIHRIHHWSPKKIKRLCNIN
jgi:transposase